MTRSTVRAFGTVAALSILLTSAACGSTTPTTTSAPASAAASATSAASTTGPASPDTGAGQGGATLNVSAQTKTFMFTFTKVEYVASVKDQHGADVAPHQGSGFEFCVITLTVKHVPGADADTFAMIFDDALDASGTTYSNPLGYLDVDGDSVTLATQTDFPLDQTLHVKTLYEVPPGTRITGLALSDISQPTVTVKLV
jgi:hypothetical protein